jgi:hypothetical protein
MIPLPCRSLFRPKALLQVFLLLLGCLSVPAWSDPPEDIRRSATATAEHVKSMACKDKATGLEFTPLGITFDIMDDLYVVDSDHSRIYVARGGIESLAVFTECPREYPDCEFIDLAPNRTGGLYASERSSGSVLALDRWGELSGYVETGAGVAGIASGQAGRVFAAMGIEGSITTVDFDLETGGMESRLSNEDGEAFPVDCCVLPSLTLVATDAFSAEVLLLSALGKPKGRAIGFDFERPFGVTCLGDRLVLVSDSDRGMVAVFEAGGRFIFAFGEGTLDTPTFLACRSDGLVCVSDVGKMTIEVFRIELPSGK